MWYELYSNKSMCILTVSEMRFFFLGLLTTYNRHLIEINTCSESTDINFIAELQFIVSLLKTFETLTSIRALRFPVPNKLCITFHELT